MWGAQKENEGDKSAEAIEKGEMPPWFYLLPHPEAKLTETETKQFIKGLVATFGRDADNEDESD
jgi:hypothetical protein